MKLAVALVVVIAGAGFAHAEEDARRALGKETFAKIQAAFATSGIDKVTLEQVPIAEPDASNATTIVRARFAVPLDRPRAFTAVLDRLLRAAPWSDVASLDLLPSRKHGLWSCRIDLVAFDAGAVLESKVAREALAQGPEAVAAALAPAVSAALERIAPEDQEAAREALARFLVAPASSADEAAALETHRAAIGAELMTSLRDLRLVETLEQAHANARRDVDEAVEDGKGIRQSRSTWLDAPRSPDRTWSAWGGGSGTTSSIFPVHEPAAGPARDVKALGAMLEDVEARALALIHLENLGTEEALRMAARASKGDDLAFARLDLIAPEVRAAVLAKDARLDLLEHAARAKDAELGRLLVEALREGGRSDAWVAAALHALTEMRHAAAAEVVAPFVGSATPSVRRRALAFFAVVDHPPVHGALLAACADEGYAASAERGLAGQTSASREQLLGALERLEALQAPEERGGHLLLALAKRSGACPKPEVVERAAARLGVTYEHVAARILSREHPDLVLEESIRGADSAETEALRRKQWNVPGYALARHARTPGRDPAWDRAVARAYEAYEQADDDAIKAPAVRAPFERAVALGCHDPMLLYRLAVCWHLAGERAHATRWYRRALEHLGTVYPKTPYVASALRVLGEWAYDEGRGAEAVSFLERAVHEEAHEARAEHLLESAREWQGAIARGVERGAIHLGKHAAPASCRHASPVRSVDVTAQGLVVSSDEGGNVKAFRTLLRPDFPKVVALGEAHLHEGAARVAWIDPSRTFATGGADGRVGVARVASDGIVDFEVLREHGVAVTALAPAPATLASGVAVLIGDEKGGVHVIAAGKATRVAADGAPVERLVAADGFLAIVRAGGAIEVHHPDGKRTAVSPAPGATVTSAEFVAPGKLVVGYSEQGVALDLEQGGTAREARVVAGTILVRHDRADRTFLAFPGHVEVLRPGREPFRYFLGIEDRRFAGLSVSLESRIFAYADDRGWICVGKYR